MGTAKFTLPVFCEKNLVVCLELVFEDALDFKKCIDAISVLIDEAEFLVSSAGLELKATDPSQISMVDFKLDKKGFKAFKLSEKEDIKLGMDLDYLSQVMARANKGEELILSLNPEKTLLQLVFKGTSKRSFSVPLIDISSSKLPSPKIEFDAELKMDAAILKDALKDAELISSHVSLQANKEHFVVEARSSKGSVVNETSGKEKSVKEFKVGKEARSVFPLEYLQDMLKGASSSEEIELKMKQDAPIVLSYKIGKADLQYFLAPRIESE